MGKDKFTELNRQRHAKRLKLHRDFGKLIEKKIKEKGLSLEAAGRAFGFRSIEEQVRDVINGKVELSFSGTNRFVTALDLSAGDLRSFLITEDGD